MPWLPPSVPHRPLSAKIMILANRSASAQTGRGQFPEYMADVHKSVLLGFSAEQMYDLVTRVADYPKFLPWCGGVEIFEQTDTLLDAKIHIHFNGIKQYFHTRNTQERPTRIDMTFADGPFKAFNGTWRFTPLRADACKIEFHLHYEFSSVILEKIIGPVFSMIANTFVDAFVKRAEVVYASQS